MVCPTEARGWNRQANAAAMIAKAFKSYDLVFRLDSMDLRVNDCGHV